MKLISLLNSTQQAIVDDADYLIQNQHKWSLSAQGYAIRCIGKTQIKLHISIMRCSVDHKNRNRLDCRRDNLRPASYLQNAYNRTKPNRNSSSKYKGVYLNKKTGRWVALIAANKKKVHIGTYDKEIDAAKAYNEMAIKLHGEFAVLNEFCSIKSID